MIPMVKFTQTGKEEAPWLIDPTLQRVVIDVDGHPHLTLVFQPVHDGRMAVNLENRKRLDGRITKAYNEFMTRLFGEVPQDPGTLTVEKEHYTTEMMRVQKRYGLEHGDPDFLEWMLTLVGRSPMLTVKGEIVYDGHHEAAGTAMGEAISSETV